MDHTLNSSDTRDMKTYCPAGRQEAACYYANKRGNCKKRMRREEGTWMKTYIRGQKAQELV